MLKLDESRIAEFRREALRASVLPPAHLAIDCIHESLQDAIDLRQPRCDASGRCCRFEAFGHRLFITTLEMGRFLAAIRESKVANSQTFDGTGCPFQVNGLCGVHASRPFGCRIFFCDPTAEQWQAEQYERMHERMKTLHRTFDVNYYYVEWREALRAVGLLG